MRALIDGDILVYQIGFAMQTTIWQAIDAAGDVMTESEERDNILGYIENFPEYSLGKRIEEAPFPHVINALNGVIQRICKEIGASSYRIYLTGKGNYREERATIMKYKGNRKAARPVHYDGIREYLVDVQKAVMVAGMEADDALGIIYTKTADGDPINTSKDPNKPCWIKPEPSVICSIDKDLLTIPGLHYSFKKDKERKLKVDESAATRAFYMQLLTGDGTDNIIGIPKIGEVTAGKLLEKAKDERDMAKIVYGEYVRYYGAEPFKYPHWSAYEDASATFTKRKLMDSVPDHLMLDGTAYSMMLENADLLWILRKAPAADGSHFWIPPLFQDEIDSINPSEPASKKQADLKELAINLDNEKAVEAPEEETLEDENGNKVYWNRSFTK